MVELVAILMLECVEAADYVGVRRDLDPGREVLVVGNLPEQQVSAQLVMVDDKLGFIDDFLDLEAS